jgi:4-diphosphocytidyl-2-C-methyl-D-erythritol kinase
MRAPSKINLFLEVIGKRPDGYHEIKTIFLPLDEPFDDISIVQSSNGIKIESDDPMLPVDEHNICWRAAAKFAEAADISPSWKISIQKRIPVAAGLGGGSSDAATVLKILDELYPGRCEIRKIAVSIGADVSYFLKPIPALGEGIGERLTALKLRTKIPLLLVNPLFPVSSAWAYANYPRYKSGEQNEISIASARQALLEGDLAKIAKSLRNDLAPALYYKFPLCEILRTSMKESGAMGAQISGSGSTLFGIFENNEKLVRASKKMKEKYADAVKIFECIIIS